MELVTKIDYCEVDWVWVADFYDIKLNGTCIYEGELHEFKTYYPETDELELVEIYKLTEEEKSKWIKDQLEFEKEYGYHWTYKNINEVIKRKMSKRVFLGGTCNDSTWRQEFEDKLTIDFFNPVVDDWDEEAYKNELREREECDYCLYVLTPKMTGVYSVAEVADDSNKRPEKTVFVFNVKDDGNEFKDHQIKSLIKVGEMVESNGGKWFKTTQDAINYLNGEKA